MADLIPLTACTGLKEPWCRFTQVADIRPLASCTGLCTLSLVTAVCLQRMPSYCGRPSASLQLMMMMMIDMMMMMMMMMIRGTSPRILPRI